MTSYKMICVATLLILLTQECRSQLSVCGQPPLNTKIVNKIVGGQAASAGSWPWQISLQHSRSHFCGGSLINSQWVMTAAHCFVISGFQASNVTAVLGLQTLSGSNPNAQYVPLNKVIVHPSYNRQTNNNDICLLQLASAVTFTNYIQPVCLAAPGSTFYNGTDSWVTGWGVTSSGSQTVSQTLMEVEVPVVGNRQCNCDYRVGSITNNMICAGLKAGGKDSCQGDSGGPLVSKQGGRWIQGGIVSFGEQCALPNFPGVYTRVSQYQSWINSQISSNQPGFITYTSTGTDGDLSVSCAGLPPVTTTAPPTTTPKPVFCGQAALNTGILEGNSSAGMWPWMVSLQMNGSHVCGGTLVAVNSVLSDANCIKSSSKPSDWTAVLGLLNQYGSNPNEVSLNVTNITLSNLTGSNVAVLHLASQPTLSNYIQPICLDNGITFAVGSICWAAGWSSGRGGVEEVLQELQATIADCGNTSSNSICTEYIALDQGDAGGPIMCKQDGSWFQAAVLTLPTDRSTTRSARSTPILTFNTISTYKTFLSKTVGPLLSPASASSNMNTVTSSTATNSTATNSTATNNTATSSTATNSTATNSTATNSTATNNTATNSTATNSTATNSTATNSTATNNTATNSTATNSTATNSTATNSTATNNTATNSTATNSTATNSTATNSTATTTSAITTSVSTTRGGAAALSHLIFLHLLVFITCLDFF